MPDTEPTLSPAEWGGILALLSLDVTQPLLPAAGWRSAQPERVLALLRARILHARAASVQSPDESIPLAQNFQRSLASECGPDELQRFQNWVQRTFPNSHAKSPDWSGWRIAFDRWLRDSSSWPESAEGSSEWKPLLLAYAKAMDTSASQAKAESAKQALLSDWDLLLFARRGFAFDDDVADPFISVLGWVERHQFQVFWRQNVAPLPPQLQEKMRQKADAILQTMEVWMPGPLRQPRLD